MKHLVFSIFAVLVLSGCTTAIKLTDEQLKLRSSLNEPEASRKLVGYLQPHFGGGLCRTASPFTNTAIAHLGFEKGILSFTAQRSVVGATSVSGGFVQTSQSLVDERESVDLRKLTRIQRIEPKDRGQSLCRPLDWSVVIAHPEGRRSGWWWKRKMPRRWSLF